MHTSEFNARDRPYSAAMTVQFPEPTNDTLDLAKAAQRVARAIYRDGYRYSKAGIVMDDLIPAGNAPRPLFDARDRDRSERIITAIDAVNAKFGRGAIAPAASCIGRDWQTKFDMRSPRYTTRVAELPRVQS